MTVPKEQEPDVSVDEPVYPRRTQASAPANTPAKQETTDTQVVRAGGSMAIATLISRITGFLRTVLIGAALGPAVASAFNTANTLPNLITELVLGAVLSSLVVPVLVRAEKEDPDRGEAFIRRLLTLTFTLTFGITLLAVAAAPLLVRVMLDDEGQVNISMANAFAYLLLPQIVFYAMFAVFMAVLNTKEIFRPGAWAPVANNVVTLAVLSLYFLLPEDTKLQPMDNVTITNPHILLLGLGTSLGVVVQALIMVPALRKAGINMKPLWGLDRRLKAFGGMAVAIVVYVAISQLGFSLNNRIASQVSDAAPTIYMNAWQMLQVPYGVIGVTLLTAVMPRLSRNAANGDDKAVVHDLQSASKLTMLAMVPVIVFFTAFGTMIAQALFAYGAFDPATADVLGWTISYSAFTLVPYSLVLLHLRVFYAREEVWTPTFIIAGITLTKLTFAFLAPSIATEPRLVVVLLGAANGLGFVAGAIIGDRLLRRSLGNLQFRTVTKTSLWALGSSLVGALVAWRVDALLVRFLFPEPTNIGMLIRLMLAGVLFLLVTGLVLSRSSLPEVLTVGTALSRLPVVGRFIGPRSQSDATTDGPAAAAADVDSPQEIAAREAAAMNVSMTTALPPLSAGGVRGPRLVAGAPLLEGTFRLLADHGGSPRSRFWQAREMATGNVVALTIMDPVAVARAEARDQGRSEYFIQSLAPGSEAVLDTKDEILRRNAQLKQLCAEVHVDQRPGMATITRVIDGGSFVVIVSEWVQGSSLNEVAESSPDPIAAARAISALADSVAAVQEAHMALGIDHRDRLRISTNRNAVVAFPGALPSTTQEQDIHGVAVALGLLLEHVPFERIPEYLVDLYREVKGWTPEQAAQADMRAVAEQLRRHNTAQMTVQEDSTPDPTDVSGFGAERANAGSFAFAAAVAFTVVVALAVTVALVLSLVGGDREDSPLSTNSLQESVSSVGSSGTRVEPQAITIKGAAEWMPEGSEGTPDNPDLAKLAADGDSSTSYETASYLAQFGEDPTAMKHGMGLLLTVPDATRLDEVTLNGLRPGTVVEVRSADAQNLKSLDDTELLGTITAGDSAFAGQGSGNGSERVSAQWLASEASGDSDGDRSGRDGGSSGRSTSTTDNTDSHEGNRILLWITSLPMPYAATVSEVHLHGTWEADAKQAETK